MRLHRLLPLSLIALAALSLGSGCPTVPSIQDRLVDLAVGGSTTLTIPASGVINTYDFTGPEDLNADLDLTSILDDAGIDVQDVKDVKLSGISYRVTVRDPNPGRTIANATVTAQSGGGAAKPLVTNFTVKVDTVTTWTRAPLDTAGVTVINNVLASVLNSVKHGGAVPIITYHVLGQSNPQGVSTSFTWQLRLDVSVVGTIKVKVLT